VACKNTSLTDSGVFLKYRASFGKLVCLFDDVLPAPDLVAVVGALPFEGVVDVVLLARV
jgi:hypothetical protein